MNSKNMTYWLFLACISSMAAPSYGVESTKIEQDKNQHLKQAKAISDDEPQKALAIEEVKSEEKGSESGQQKPLLTREELMEIIAQRTDLRLFEVAGHQPEPYYTYYPDRKTYQFINMSCCIGHEYLVENNLSTYDYISSGAVGYGEDSSGNTSFALVREKNDRMLVGILRDSRQDNIEAANIVYQDFEELSVFLKNPTLLPEDEKIRDDVSQQICVKNCEALIKSKNDATQNNRKITDKIYDLAKNTVEIVLYDNFFGQSRALYRNLQNQKEILIKEKNKKIKNYIEYKESKIIIETIESLLSAPMIQSSADDANEQLKDLKKNYGEEINKLKAKDDGTDEFEAKIIEIGSQYDAKISKLKENIRNCTKKFTAKVKAKHASKRQNP